VACSGFLTVAQVLPVRYAWNASTLLGTGRSACATALSNLVATRRIFPYPEGDERERRDSMVIHLTPEQERRVQVVMDRGAYESVEEVVDAALAAVEERTVPAFTGTQEELDALLAEGLASKELAEDEFWGSVNAQTNALLAEHKTGPRS